MAYNIKNIAISISQEIGFDVTEKLNFIYKNNRLTIQDKENHNNESYSDYSKSEVEQDTFNIIIRHCKAILKIK